jgi:hypothetical protein
MTEVWTVDTVRRGEWMRWAGPEQTVALHQKCRARIFQQVLSAQQAIRRRGLEAGGLLLSTVERMSGHEVSIDAVEPIRCEHRFGPSFQLSESDEAELASQVERIHASGRVVAGYYRSITGGEVGAAQGADDEALIRKYLGPTCVVVIRLQVNSPLSCRTEVAWREEEGWWQLTAAPAEPAPPARPAQSWGMSAPAPVSLEAVGAAVASQAPAASPPDSAPLPPSPARQPRISWLPLFLAFVTLAAGAVAAYRWGRSLASGPQRPLLGLAADWNGPALAVRWEPRSPSVERAERAELSVREGQIERSIALTKPDLAAGATRVEVSGRDVSLTFRLFWDGSEVAESIRAVRLTGRGAPAPAAPTPAPAAQPPRWPAGEPLVREPLVVPEGIQARIEAPISLSVAVEIDERGNVIRATPQKEGDALFRYLGGLAAENVRRWRYRPVRDPRGVAARGFAKETFRFEPVPR